MWRLLFIGFLIAHGFVHLAIWLSPMPKDQTAPFDPGHSWLLGDRRGLAVAVAVVAAVILVVAGLGLWGHADWWRSAAVIGLTISFGLMVLYFTPWYLFIGTVNVALVVAIVWLSWPSKSLVGA